MPFAATESQDTFGYKYDIQTNKFPCKVAYMLVLKSHLILLLHQISVNYVNQYDTPIKNFNQVTSSLLLACLILPLK